MNLSIETLPRTCAVLVVGAGPAGSATATTLARRGVDVVAVDQHAFPRDKVCGDGLIPDAHRALEALGVLDQVMEQAARSTHVRCFGPRGGRVDVPGRLAVLPRKILDDILCRNAVAAGARMHAPVRFSGPIEEDGVVVGARLQQGAAVAHIRAKWVVLATGAVPQALIASGMALRQTPSGVALRGYVKNERMADRIRSLEVVWNRALAPGYGWIFPCGQGVFNIGVGVAESHEVAHDDKLAMREINLHRVMQAFQAVHPSARELMQGAEILGPMKGAALRCTLDGARFSRPGLFVTGEAAGSTYSFTGEGIGKALETGIHAGEALLGAGAGLFEEGPIDLAADAQARSDFESRLLSLKPRFELYRRANVVNRHPWLTDLAIWRANRNPRIVARMAGVLEETSNPGHMISVKGFARLLLERR